MTTQDITNRRRASDFARVLSAVGIATLLIFGAAGCKSSSSNAATTAAINNGTGTDTAAVTDPAAANLAPAGSTQVLDTGSSYTPQQQSESYQGQQPPAPIVRGYAGQDDDAEAAGEQAIDQTDQPPPPLPDYDQPPAPDPNYLWTPGYWAWGPGGYYWVPGEWTLPPYYGALWTPPYWGYDNGRYGFHPGYWGPYVGYYGGIDYGFGYIGIGYFGGYWNGNNFYYNRAVTNVGRGGHAYDRAVVYNNRHYSGRIENRTSYNGGHGGINVRPRPSELAAAHEHRTGALPEQRQAEQTAAHNKQQFYSANHGKPAEGAAAHPGTTSHRAIAQPPAAVRQERQRATQQRAATAQRSNAAEQRNGAPAERGAPAAHNAPAERGAPAAHSAPAERGAPAARNAPAERTAPAAHNAPAERHAPAERTAPAERNAPAERRAPAAQRPAETHSAPVQRTQPTRQAEPRPQAAPRPEAAPRPQAAPRQEAAPRPQPAPRPQAAPRPQPAPRQEAAPRREAQPHSAPRDENHRDDKRPPR